jgi:single-strand DNA-binding protein
LRFGYKLKKNLETYIMASVNKLTLLGNLGKDVEVRYLPSGDPVANFSLATTETWKSKDGSKQEKTEWHRVSVFGKLAEIARDYLSKGSQVYIEGQLTYNEWSDKEGVKRITAEVKLSGPRAVLVLLGGGDRGTTRRSEQPKGEPSERTDFRVADDDVPF